MEKRLETLNTYPSIDEPASLDTSEEESEEESDEETGLLEVERQTEFMHKDGTIWAAAINANKEAVRQLVTEKPAVIYSRGLLGECPIHMLFLYGTDAHLEIAQYLITRFPKIVTQTYKKKEYRGENILHIAIIKSQITMIEWLFSEECTKPYRNTLLSATATGDFFQIGRPTYYGETPLGFACCTNQWNIVKILVENGADINTVDSNGNNILHMLVIRDLPDAYFKFKNLWQKKSMTTEVSNANDNDASKFQEIERSAPWNRLNKDKFTPLTLAANFGHAKTLLQLFSDREKILWSYGNCSCVLHPLRQLDHGFQEDADGTVSVLDLIVKQQDEKLMLPMLISLIDKKWNKFAYRKLMRRFTLTFVYLLIFLGTTILEQIQPEKIEHEGNKNIVANDEYSTNIHWMLFAVGHLIVIVGALWKGYGEVKEMYTMGVQDYLETTGSRFLENCLSCSFCLSILTVEILHLYDIPVRVVVFAFAALLGWAYMLFFIMPFRFTGPFVIMIYKMLFNDVLRFCIIYTIFLGGFSQALFILFNNNGFFGYFASVKQCFLGLLGDFDLDVYVDTPYPLASVSLLIFYIILITILLLNLLIAMMGDTFQDVKSSATELWHLERARIVLAIESEMSTYERKLKKNRYWVEIKGERYLQVEVENNKFGWKLDDKEGNKYYNDVECQTDDNF